MLFNVIRAYGPVLNTALSEMIAILLAALTGAVLRDELRTEELLHTHALPHHRAMEVVCLEEHAEFPLMFPLAGGRCTQR